MLIRTKITGIGDPFILREGNVYYAFATSAADGFRFFTSRDLLDWEEGGYCYSGSRWAENCFWAPEVYRYRGKYYLLYTGRWNKNHSLRIGLAVADKPQGPYRDINDGPLFDLGYACIDATLLFDGDSVYLYFVRDCSENVVDGQHISEIYCAELSSDLLSFKTEPKKITTPDALWERESDPVWHWNEGPAVLKHGGKYYLNYSVNFYASPDYSVACAVADDPTGPFIKYADNPVLKKRAGDFSGPGHNSFFYDEKGELFTAFHIHTDPESPSGDRRMCIAKAGFDGGRFYIEA